MANDDLPGASRAIDIHTHIVPEKFPAYTGVGRNVPWPSMAPAHACHAHVMVQGKIYRTVHESCWMPQTRVKDMDALAIGMQALSPMPELLSYWLDAKDAQPLIRYVNDEIATMVAQFPKRFCGLGAVPLQDVDLAVRELEYVLQLGFKGVELASHVNGVSIGDPRFEPFFAAAEKMGAAIFVHALRPIGQDRIVGPVSEQVACFPGDIGLCAASFITGGMAERHPNLRIAFSHGGGVLPILLGRLNRAWDIQPKLKEALPQPPTAYAKRFYYDAIVVFEPATLRLMMQMYGTSQICIGSDYPFAMGEPDPVRFLERCELDPDTNAAMLWGNAERFLGSRRAQ